MERKECADIKMTFERILTLHYVPHFLKVRRNLISGLLVEKSSYEIILESNKIVIMYLLKDLTYKMAYSS